MQITLRNYSTALRILLCCIFLSINLYCSIATANSYSDALADINSGNLDYAFVELNSYLREHPDSKYAARIKFAICEYYSQTKNNNEALKELTQYIIEYPDEKNTVFAQAMLYKILIDNQGDPELISKLKETFFSKSIFLIFSDSKAKTYCSIFNNRYKILDYVNKIDIFKNDELFLQITP